MFANFIYILSWPVISHHMSSLFFWLKDPDDPWTGFITSFNFILTMFANFIYVLSWPVISHHMSSLFLWLTDPDDPWTGFIASLNLTTFAISHINTIIKAGSSYLPCTTKWMPHRYRSLSPKASLVCHYSQDVCLSTIFLVKRNRFGLYKSIGKMKLSGYLYPFQDFLKIYWLAYIFF